VLSYILASTYLTVQSKSELGVRTIASLADVVTLKVYRLAVGTQVVIDSVHNELHL